MKFTSKEYTRLTETRKQFRNLVEEWTRLGRHDKAQECKEGAERSQNILDRFPTVPVKYYIGYRQYFQEVVKCGKSYFLYGRKMTKGNGYRSIEEIDEITPKMTEAMISDSYYY